MGSRGPVGMKAFASEDPERPLQAFREAFSV
jgi:hydroxypyruvate isomerase